MISQTPPLHVGLRTFLDSSPNGVVVVDGDGDIVYGNAALHRVFGYPPGELVGRSIEDLVPERVRVAHVAMRQKFMENPRARPMGPGAELSGQRKDGSEFPAEISLTPLASEQGLLVAGEITDISERRRIQEQLQANARDLERSNQELQDFAYVASHDLQEPLRKVQAFGARLAEKFGPVLGDKGRDYVERMTHAASRMQRLIDDLLAYSRVGTRPSTFEPVDLDKVLEAVLEDLSVRIHETGAKVEREGLPRLQADPTQMGQLLLNLVGNALKFRRPDVPPRVQVRGRIESQAVPPGKGRKLAVIEVEDNGIGFDPVHADRIFNIFERLHGRDEYEGTGVGLAICRKIASRHGGRIRAVGHPDQGATFVVELPVVQDPVQKLE